MRLPASAVLCLPILASQAPNPPRLEVPRLAQAPSMAQDADLSTWEGALRITDFGMMMPDDRGENRWPTVVHVAWGPDALYVAAECMDPNPSQVRMALHSRDAFSGDLDFFGLELDPSGKGQSTLRLMTTASGGQFDAIYTETSGENYTYDCLWDSVGLLTPSGYLVKMRIPYSSLRRVPGDWLMRFYRLSPRERRYGTSWPKGSKSIQCDICQMARASGAPINAPGSPFLLVPFATYHRTQRLDRNPMAAPETKRQLGLDLRYASTSFTLEGTYRPDFATADADVDPLQINSRFEVYYPERRPFFLEGMELLGVRGAQRQFFSRSILSPLYGVKASGQAGWASWTALSARDEDGGKFLASKGAVGTEGLATQDTAAAARFRLDDRGSGLSLLGTEKRLLSGPARSGGQSGGIYLDQYLGSEFRVLASAMTSLSHLPLAGGSLTSDRGTATSTRVEWNTRHWNAFLQQNATSPDLNLLSGFTDLQGYRQRSAGLGWQNSWNQGPLARTILNLWSRDLTWWNGDPLDRTTGLNAYIYIAGRWSIFVNWDIAGRTWAKDQIHSGATRSLNLNLAWRRHSWGQIWIESQQGRTLEWASGVPARSRSLSLGSGGAAGPVSYELSAQTSMLDREVDHLRLVRGRSLVATALWQLPGNLYVKTQAFAVRYDGSDRAKSVDKYLKAFAGWRPNAFTHIYAGWSGQRRLDLDPKALIQPERMVERGLFAKVAYAVQF